MIQVFAVQNTFICSFLPKKKVSIVSKVMMAYTTLIKGRTRVDHSCFDVI